MDRDDAAAYLSERLGEYLIATSRIATDGGTGTLTPAIDDALRALGYAFADLAAAETADDTERDDWEVQLLYRALLQLKRDIGAQYFRVSVGGESFDLGKIRDSIEKDLTEARDAVIERFGTVGMIPADGSSGIVTLDLNFLDDRCEVLA